MIMVSVKCVHCGGTDLSVYGYYKEKRRYKCQPCNRVFLSKYTYNACDKNISEKVLEMSMNGNGMREISRVLKIARNTVTSILKKKPTRSQM